MRWLSSLLWCAAPTYGLSQASLNALTQSSEQPIAVDAVRIDRAAADKVLTLPGDTRSFYETTIFARTSGYLSKWYVDIGDRVKEGQVLATIETPELDDQLTESKARLAQLKAEANVSATSSQFAKVSFDRWEAAAPDGVVSAQERDQKKSELDQSVAKLEASRSAVNLGEAEVQRLQTLEKFKNVLAPFEGVITDRHIDIGALVTAGSTTNTTPLFTLSQFNQVRIFVDIPQPAAPGIHVGMQATATTRELGELVFNGVVDRTASSIDPRSRTLKVEVLVPNPDLVLLPGMYVQVTFKTSRRNPPLRIPAAALCFTTDGPRVALIDARGKVTFRPVTIERDLGYCVEIGSGLADGDWVALNVGSQVSEGERVEAHLVDAPLNPMPLPPRLHASTRPSGPSL